MDARANVTPTERDASPVDCGSSSTERDDSLSIGLVVYEGLDHPSGGFRYDRELVSRLRKRGDTVEVIELPWRRYPTALAMAYSPAVRSRLDRDVDVLVEDGLCHPVLGRHNRRLERPDAVVGLVHHLRSDDPTERFRSLVRPFERRFLDSLDGAIYTSRFTARRARACCPDLRSRPSLVAHPAGRAEAAALSPVAVADRARSEPFRVVYVGSVVPRKDVRTLLAALSRLDAPRIDPVDSAGTDEDIDWRLTVVGDRSANAEYAADVASRARELGIDDRVEFLGTVPDRVLEDVLESAHVCCVPSRYEAFGMAYLEAMERGAVPIAGSVGGASEFLTDGTNGVLVEPADPAALADHLSRLATDRDLLARLAGAALGTADRQPGWEATAAAIRSFCRRLAVADRGRSSDVESGSFAPNDVQIEPWSDPL
ncbi:glycosyltransferase family 4 protein [Halopenitus sp. H-Gu1]|uniref:glycosyltransferase family 4 protein n=1 Tax=Halopenitus sp. H-Gu1 TaxID=3242697 RepID=UPI00359D600A